MLRGYLQLLICVTGVQALNAVSKYFELSIPVGFFLAAGLVALIVLQLRDDR